MQAAVVRPEVAGRAGHREGLLHAQEAPERPLAVELHDRLGRGGGEALLRDDVLAGVVTFCGAAPEEEAVEDCCVRG